LSQDEKGDQLYRHPSSAEDLVGGGKEPAAEPEAAAAGPEPEAAGSDLDQGSYEIEAEEADEPSGGANGVVVSLATPDFVGDYAAFVCLPDGLLIIEEYEGESELAVFADAVESRLRAPYRARVVRTGGDRFVVIANEIETVEIPRIEGEQLIVVAAPDGARKAVLDGAPVPLPSLGLDSILDLSAPCLLKLDNIDEETWELSVEPF
jgi:hypothetical protein